MIAVFLRNVFIQLIKIRTTHLIGDLVVLKTKRENSFCQLLYLFLITCSPRDSRSTSSDYHLGGYFVASQENVCTAFSKINPMTLLWYPSRYTQGSAVPQHCHSLSRRFCCHPKRIPKLFLLRITS